MIERKPNKEIIDIYKKHFNNSTKEKIESWNKLEETQRKEKNNTEIIKIIQIAFGLNVDTLQEKSDEVKDDFNIMKILVMQNFHALKYASDRLKDDQKMLEIALQKSPLALQYASLNLRGNKDIVKVALTRDKKCSEAIVNETHYSNHGIRGRVHCCQ
jgi:hypothetical protein